MSDNKKDGRGKQPNSFGTRIKRGEVRNPEGRPLGATGLAHTRANSSARENVMCFMGPPIS
jgi:hypothetical protein